MGAAERRRREEAVGLPRDAGGLSSGQTRGVAGAGAWDAARRGGGPGGGHRQRWWLVVGEVGGVVVDVDEDCWRARLWAQAVIGGGLAGVCVGYVGASAMMSAYAGGAEPSERGLDGVASARGARRDCGCDDLSGTTGRITGMYSGSVGDDASSCTTRELRQFTLVHLLSGIYV